VAPEPSSKRYRQDKIPHLGQDQNLPFRDKRRTKTPGYSRVYFINPSGTSHHRDLLDFCEILHILRSIETYIFGLPQSNLDTLKPTIRARLERICNDFFGTSLLASSTSSLSAHTPYKPGGTLTGAAHNLCGRYQTSGSDPHGLGRWSFVQLYGKGRWLLSQPIGSAMGI
jgi:hypothetical protein